MRKARRRASVNRRLLGIVLFAAVAAIALVRTLVPEHGADICDSNPAEVRAAAAAGEREGARVVHYPAGSMARENAILEIRARESEIRSAGFGAAADAFAGAAESRMRADGVL